MKIYGYTNGEVMNANVASDELAEISLIATPIELRRIASFLSTCATNMEAMGSNYSHEHLSDRDPLFKLSPHFVVLPPDENAA